MEADQRLTGAGAHAPKTSEGLRPLPHVEGVEHRFVQLPGLGMHVAMAGAGSPVLLLHGSPMHWWEWHKLIPDLARDHRLVIPDLRGQGWTEAPRAGYGQPQMVADVIALLDALDLERVDIVSHDMGAISGYGVCWLHPQRVRRHVALGVPPLFIRMRADVVPRFRRVWHQVLAVPGIGPALAASARQRVPRHMLAFPPGRPAPWSEEESAVFLAPLREPARAHAKSALYRHLVLPQIRHMVTGAYRRRRLLTPTMVIAGEHDPLFPPTLLRELLADADRFAEEVELVGIPGGAHHLPAEAPAEVAAHILRFLARA